MADDTLADILDEHRHVTDLIGRLQTAMEDEKAGEPWAEQVAGMLDQLVKLLREHFGGEAETTFFQEMIEAEPRLTNQLQKLALEHSAILRAFVEGADLAKRLSTGEGEAKQLRRKVQVAIATLRRHEAEENELVMQAYWDDMGGRG
ncbi:MAG: hemerythrin domain-containing protein [Polyangiaceae bacterium]